MGLVRLWGPMAPALVSLKTLGAELSCGLSSPFAHDMPLSWDLLGAELVLVDALSLFVT